MPDVPPLTAEEILTLRGMLQRRKWVLTAFWGGLGTAAAAWLADSLGWF